MAHTLLIAISADSPLLSIIQIVFVKGFNTFPEVAVRALKRCTSIRLLFYALPARREAVFSKPLRQCELRLEALILAYHALPVRGVLLLYLFPVNELTA